MAEPGVEGVARWPLRGSWLTWLRVSALIGLVLLVAGAVLAMTHGRALLKQQQSQSECEECRLTP